jgi:CheY-like chemotaxis protein
MAHILVVDDNPQLLGAMEKILERDGHTTQLAGDGNAALRLANSGTPDLVLTDMYMPDADGIEMILALKRTCPQTRIVAMSGGGYLARDSILAVARRLGAHAILTKPFSHTELIAAVDEALRERLSA